MLAQAAQVHVIETAVNDADGSTLSAVAVNQYAEIGSTYTTVTAPAISGVYRFTHWTYSGTPATSYCDAWGRSQNPISFLLLVASTATAHYLPATRDTDGDGLPDWYEMEYFGDLTRAASNDSDGDGITLLAEYTNGTSPLYANITQEGGVVWTDSGLVTCNLAGYATYTLRSVPADTVNQSAPVPPGTVITVPDLSTNPSFAYWTLDGVRQNDAWGRALSTFSFSMGSSNREAVAYLLTGDSDGDGVPDAYEQNYYGTLANSGASDTDGDGITLLTEYTNGTSPIYANSTQEGGVAWVDSGLITCNLTGYATYTLRSVPVGAVNQSAIVAPGTVITVPDLSTNASFAYWTLDGVRQNDAWGRALSTFSFTMGSSNREAVAYLLTGDSDGDGVPDAYEQNYYGTLANNGSSDTDGDGITLLAEYTNGTSPIQANSTQEGGVAWVDSPLTTVVLQANIAVEQPTGTSLADGESSSFGYVAVGSTASRTFTIRNVGGTPLTGFGITLTGTDAAMFSVIASPTAPLLHDGSTNFTVQFAPTSTGPKTAALHIASNDANENPFDIILTGNDVAASPFEAWMNAANMPAESAGPLQSPYGDGAVNLQKFAFNLDPTRADSRHLLAGAGGTAGLPGFTKGANGRLRLEFIRRKVSGNPGITYRAEFSTDLVSWVDLTGLATVTSINGTWERLLIEDVPPAGAKSRFARVMVKENAATAGMVPLIVVEQAGGIGMIDGISNLDVGAAATGAQLTMTFTVKNIGTADLTGLDLSKGGANAAEFTLGTLGATTLAAGTSTTFTVIFTPSVTGLRTAAIHVASNDTASGPFDISLIGTGTATALQAWRQTNFGSIDNRGDGEDLNDFDKDGIPNLIEFAFGLNPIQNSAGLLPLPQRTGNNFVISFAQPAGVSGITYGAEWSETLLSGSWMSVADSGMAPQHTFSVPIGTKTKLYMRLKVASP